MWLPKTAETKPAAAGERSAVLSSDGKGVAATRVATEIMVVNFLLALGRSRAAAQLSARRSAWSVVATATDRDATPAAHRSCEDQSQPL